MALVLLTIAALLNFAVWFARVLLHRDLFGRKPTMILRGILIVGWPIVISPLLVFLAAWRHVDSPVGSSRWISMVVFVGVPILGGIAFRYLFKASGWRPVFYAAIYSLSVYFVNLFTFVFASIPFAHAGN